MSAFQVRTTVLPNGERLAVLTGRDGLPVFCPTVYAVSELRGRNLAFATISNSLRTLIVLELFLHGNGIQLNERLTEGQLLSVAEIDSLAVACRQPLESVQAHSRNDARQLRSAAAYMESHRRRESNATVKLPLKNFRSIGACRRSIQPTDPPFLRHDVTGDQRIHL